MRLLLPYPIAILRLMLSYGPMPTLPWKKKRAPVVVVAVAVDDSLAERSNKANMTTRKQEFRSILRVLEIGHIVKVPLACLLVVCAFFTNKPLDFNSEINSHFCLFRRERRRRLLRSPLDFFLNKVAVSFDIGVRCFFRREYRRRLW